MLRWGPGEEGRAAALLTLSKKSLSPPLSPSTSLSSPPRPPDVPRLHRAPRGARGAVRGGGHGADAPRGGGRDAHARPLRADAARAFRARRPAGRRSFGNARRPTIVRGDDGQPRTSVKPPAAFSRRRARGRRGLAAGAVAALSLLALARSVGADRPPVVVAARESLPKDRLFPVPFGEGETLVYTIAWLKIEGGAMTLKTDARDDVRRRPDAPDHADGRPPTTTSRSSTRCATSTRPGSTRATSSPCASRSTRARAATSPTRSRSSTSGRRSGAGARTGRRCRSGSRTSSRRSIS